MDRKILIGTLIGVLVGLAVAVPTTYFLSRGPSVKTVNGTVNAVNSTGDAIGITMDTDESQAYRIAGAWWSDLRSDGSWHDSPPTCLTPMSNGQRVRLGVIEVNSTGGRPSSPIVVWLECLPGT